ncbi:MAG: ABC transporter permease subunit [Anaerolineae bacterium]|nr:ABC transporter permease subunit [Anaerolineae bacterium]
MSTIEPVQPGQGTAYAGMMKAQPQAATTTTRRRGPSAGGILRQAGLQVFLIFVSIIVLFPVMWIVSMAVDPRGIARPTDLNLIPANASLDAFTKLLTQPLLNVLPIYFGEMLMNSLFIALGVSLFTVVLGSSAAYSFSRFRFRGREGGMLVFIMLLLLPSTGLVIPLYIIFSQVQITSQVAEFFPAVFAGVMIASLVYIAFSLVRSYARHDYERRFNPGPRAVTIFMVVVLLIVSVAAWLIMFTRTPLYRDVFLNPIGVYETSLATARTQFNQRDGSANTRLQTANRREQSSTRVAATLSNLLLVRDRLAELSDTNAIRSALDTVAGELQNLEPANVAFLDTLRQSLETASPDEIRAAVEGLATEAQATADSARSGAASAAANAQEAIVARDAAQQSLTEAQAAYDEQAGQLMALRNQAFVQLIPYGLVTFGLGMLLSVILYAVTALFKNSVEPKRMVVYMLLLLMSFLLVVITYQTWEWRLLAAGTRPQTLRTTLLGLALAFAAGGFPFAIWSLKGYFDTIPKEIEEAARIDGAGRLQTFFVVMIPLALPAFAIVILFAFMNGWTEFILSWIFMVGQTQNYTLAMGLATMTGGTNTPPPDMQRFAAMAILISVPILALFFAFQKWMVSGLSLGGVKG